MYRYTAKKNNQANKKFQQKQLNKKKKKPVRGGKVATAGLQSSPRKKHISKAKRVAQTKQVKRQKPEEKSNELFPEWVVWLTRYVGGAVLMVALVMVIYLIGMNNFLPQFFHLEQEKSILLVGSAINERADKVYLVKMLPMTEAVEVVAISPEALVPVIGGYGQYPLGSLAPFLNFETNNVQEVTAAYNFALKQVLDEVYFLPEMGEIADLPGVRRVLGDIVKDELQRTTRVDKNLLDEYFQVRVAKFFTLDKLETVDDEVGTGTKNYGKEKLVGCPVVLINAAGVNGLAKKVSNMVEMNGFAVVNWETSSDITGKSKIYYDETQEDCLQVVEAVRKIFPKVEEIVPDGGEQAKKSRAKAIITLGQELSD